MTWTQVYNPFHNIWLSAIVAALPIAFFFLALTILRIKGHIAATITVALSILIAIVIYHMPVSMAAGATGYGFAYGLWPISYIVVTAVFLYKLSVKSGQFDIIRRSIVSITDDKRLQMLLVAFSFNAFLEGAAGFGAPIAITAALLVGLGFNPLKAAGLCLIANTASGAFGAMGIPVIVAGQVSGISAMEIGKFLGTQLPFISFFVPFLLIFIMDGWKGVREVWPAIVVSGGSYAVTQYVTVTFIGPELPNITSAIVSLVFLALFLKIWQPHVQRPVGGKAHVGKEKPASILTLMSFAIFIKNPHKIEEGTHTIKETDAGRLTAKQMIKAWSPFITLTVMVTIWSTRAFKGLFAPGGAFESWTINVAVPGLHNQVFKIQPIVNEPTPYAAVLKLDLFSATGTAILIAALLSMVILKIHVKTGWETLVETIKELAKPILTIMMVLGFAFVANYSGLSSTLGLALASTAGAFPFLSPVLGWIGVFLTGSVTSGNALFGSLQVITAEQISVLPMILIAANTAGGVMAKMLSPQSVAVAAGAVGLVGKESDLFRFTLKYSMVFLIVTGIVTLGQAFFLS